MSKTDDVLREVADERAAQDAKWGQQNHPDGTGDTATAWPDMVMPAFGWSATPAVQAAALARKSCEDGERTWLKIALEEMAEAFAEKDPVLLRKELVQTASVLVAWIEAIDRRTAAASGDSADAKAKNPSGRFAFGDKVTVIYRDAVHRAIVTRVHQEHYTVTIGSQGTPQKWFTEKDLSPGWPGRTPEGTR